MQVPSLATAILGAGFSFTAGLPLTSDLFETSELPWAIGGRQAHNIEVLAAYREWKAANPDKNAEQWLKFLFERPLLAFETKTTWENAISFALARLVKLRKGKKAHLFHGITTSVSSATHRRFWGIIRTRCNLRSVVTTNYDILIEQGLKDEYSQHRTAPLCYYGGFPMPQTVKMWRNPATNSFDMVRLGTDIALYKLHGSLNWAREPRPKFHENVSPVFRSRVRNDEEGPDRYSSRFEDRSPAVIPPLPEKQRPDWLVDVWAEAERALRRSEVWIVCGYSMADYDEAVRELFRKAAMPSQKLRRIVLMSPDSTSRRHRWESICSSHVSITCLPGLPEVLDLDWW